MTTPHEIVESTFSLAWSNAQIKSQAADNLFRSAVASFVSPPQLTGARVNYTPGTFDPEFDDPADEILSNLDRERRRTLEQLTDLFSDYLAEHLPFPDELRLAKAWLLKALTTGGTGISAEAEDMAWQSARSDVLGPSLDASRAVLDEYAARGFSRVPGAAAARLHAIGDEARQKSAEASTQVARQQITMEVENIRFAVEQALELYAQALAAAQAFIGAFARGAQVAVQKVEVLASLEGKLRSALAALDRIAGEIGALSTQVQIANIGLDATKRSKNIGWEAQHKKIRVSAAINAAQSTGAQAAAMLNALNVSTKVEADDREGVSYRYGGDVNTDVPPTT